MKNNLVLALIFLSQLVAAQEVFWSEVAHFSFNVLAARENKVYGSNYTGVYMAPNGGITPVLIGNGGSDGMTLKGDTIFVSFSHCYGPREGIYYSINDGASWEEVNSGYDVASVDYELCSNDSHVFIAGSQGVYRSVNGGSAWEKVLSSSYLDDGGAYSIACLGPLIVAGSADKVFISQDNGTTWTSKAVPITQNIVWEVAIHDGKIFIGTPDGIFVSSNSGTTWVHKGAHGLNISSIKFCGNTVVAGCFNMGGALYSQNLGETWTNINTGLENTNLNVNYILPFQGDFLMSCNYLQKSTGIACSGTTNLTDIASLFSVSPNPTVAGMVIKTDWNNYDLVIYDVNGRQVFSQNDLQGTYILDDYTLPVKGIYRLALKMQGKTIFKSIAKI